MKPKKDELIEAAINLYAEKGVKNVSMKKIGNEIDMKRTNVHYYFANGKDEIIDSIITIFDNMIVNNLKIITDADLNGNIESILELLFLAFKKEESEMGRKINKIIFSDHAYEPKIKEYLKERFYEQRESRYTDIFDLLVRSGKIEPFDTIMAARILTKIFIACCLEDSFSYPFESQEMPQCLGCLRKDCLLVLKTFIKPNQ